MTAISIILMTLVVFLSRYLFLEPSVPVKLSYGMRRFLSYSSPAVLTAICGPIVFAPDGEAWIGIDNPYLIAALVAALVMFKTKNLLLSIVVSMALFLLLNLVLFPAITQS
ncbi:AzlD domain-containing protein [Vibrio hannami]|uniref:AzlD domain-containing protein n=1 Tax=Vibrio hannami TaxID=2717094 RepID=UPI00240EC289|nr:AzlD domain-containing protein [Vibrio hannami]MDG3085711.1 AzlD domain-containing protein [Vibrio hannami]